MLELNTSYLGPKTDFDATDFERWASLGRTPPAFATLLHAASRNDAASFRGPYTSKGILPADPFVTLDQEGVGEPVGAMIEIG